MRRRGCVRRAVRVQDGLRVPSAVALPADVPRVDRVRHDRDGRESRLDRGEREGRLEHHADEDRGDRHCRNRRRHHHGDHASSVRAERARHNGDRGSRDVRHGTPSDLQTADVPDHASRTDHALQTDARRDPGDHRASPSAADQTDRRPVILD